MSIMDFFKPSTTETSSSKPIASDPIPGKDNLSDSPPTIGPDGKIPGTDPNTVNPLDAYKKMFDNASNGSEIQAPQFKLDPAVINDVSGKMDFTKGVDPEVLSKATNGDVSAMMQIIKTVGQNSYKAAIEHGTALTDTFITQRGEYEKSQISNGVRSQLTNNELSSAPNYSHPVVKAELNRVAAGFARANPDASPSEVAKAAQKYIQDLQMALNPTDSKTSQNKEEMDWSKYLNS